MDCGDHEKRMKFIVIVMLFFILNLSISIVNTLDQTPAYKIQPQESLLADASQQSLQGEEYFQSAAAQDASTNFGFGDFVKGFWLFVKTFSKGVVAPKYILTQFGVNSTIATYFSLPIYLLYSLAIAQFVSNRSTKGMK